MDKNRRIQSFLNDIRENNSVINISTTLVPSLDISIDDGQIYEIIEKSLEMWLEERIDCTNFQRSVVYDGEIQKYLENPLKMG